MSDSTFRVLFHATPISRLRSIRTLGLLPGCARGKLKVVWLHSLSKSSWAISHVAERHGVAEAQVVIIKLAIPRAWLRRNRRGVWVCDRVGPPSRFISVRPVAFAAA